MDAKHQEENEQSQKDSQKPPHDDHNHDHDHDHSMEKYVNAFGMTVMGKGSEFLDKEKQVMCALESKKEDKKDDINTSYLYGFYIQNNKNGNGMFEFCKENNLYPTLMKATTLAMKAKSKENQTISEEQAIAVSLYTSNAIYKRLNQAFRLVDCAALAKLASLASPLIQGVRSLPRYVGKVYRGVVLKESATHFLVHSVLIWHGFTSASKSESKARNFLKLSKSKSTDEKMQRVMFHIHSKSGREIDELSFYPQEEEVVFRPATYFRIMSIQQDGDILLIEVVEIHESLSGEKTLIWIDDCPESKDNAWIRKVIETERVTVVSLTSTEEAFEFFQHNKDILTRGIDHVRIVTDMTRFEKGQLNIEAGIDVVKILRNLLGYSQPLMIYTSEKYQSENQDKVAKQNWSNVYVVAKRRPCFTFAQFQPLKEVEKLI
jgi:hypothetical protein